MTRPRVADAAAPPTGANGRAGKPLQLKQSIVIAASVSRVFAYRCLVEQVPVWQPDVLACNRVTPGPTTVGTVYTELRQAPHDTTQEWVLEVTAFEQDRLLEMTGHCDAMRTVERHQFEMADKGTCYTLALELSDASLPTTATQKRIVNDLLHLKWVLEAPPGTPPPSGIATKRSR